jgi:hypothetical protein
MLWSPHSELLYPFENQANDYSGNARHGLVFGSGVYPTKPNGGRCLYFDGVGDYVLTPSFGLSGTVLIFSCQIRFKVSAVLYQIIIGDDALSSTIGFITLRNDPGTNYLKWYYADGGSAPSAIDPTYFQGYDDTWLHMLVACDYSGKTTCFYRNGILHNSQPLVNSPVFPSTSRAKYVGSYNSTDFLLIAGYLQNVYLASLQTCPPVAALTANANRLMLGMHPIW